VRFRIPHLLLAFAAGTAVLTAQDQGPTSKLFAIGAHRYAFEPARIEVNEDDLVKIELQTSDIAHSLTIDEYRIAKRVGPGQPVTFEFRADKPGTFEIQVSTGSKITQKLKVTVRDKGVFD